MNRKRILAMLLAGCMLCAGYSHGTPGVQGAAAALVKAADTAEPADPETAAAAETTTETTVTETESTSAETATETESTSETTTTSAVPAPAFLAEIPSKYPGGETAFTLRFPDNPGLEALGFSVQLPEVLTPRLTDGEPQITLSSAFAGDAVYCYYNAEKHVLSLSYAADQAGSPEALLLTVPLQIAAEAEIGTEYPFSVQIDSLAPGDLPETPLTGSFTP